MARTFYNPYERDPVSAGSNSNDPPKVIRSLEIDLSDIKAATNTRSFTVRAENGAVFSLEVKNEDSYYYNFNTKAFQAGVARLDNKTVKNGYYTGAITFPTVADDDQYDIYLWAETNTVHTSYVEARFSDGSMDINNSEGSNSFLLQKVIYQYTDSTLTLQGFSPNGTVAGTMGTDTVAVTRFGSKTKTAFSFTATAGATAAYRILKQPVADDILSFVAPVIGNTPVDLPGENIYPAVSNTDTVDGTGFAAGTATKIVMDTNVADKMVVGDKITIATTALTDTVDGAVSSGVKVVMDNNVATKMAVGDRITATLAGVPHALLTETHPTIVTVAALDPDGDNAKEFSMSQAVSLSDGATLTFTPKCNRELFTVAALDPDEDNAKEFSYVDSAGSTTSRFGVRDGATLSFSNRKNFSWLINNYANILTEDMIVVPDNNVTADTSVGVYEDITTIFEGTENEKKIIKNKRPALSTLAKKPTVVKGLVTVQEGQIVFNKQQVLALAGDTIKIGGYGEQNVLDVYGYEIILSDLAITLTAPTTTTSGAVSASATVGVADREGVINNVSRIGGIGINPRLQNPLITAGGGADGAGNFTVDAAQTLESGIGLTIENTGRIATITGNIEILKTGTSDQTIRFDIEKLLSTSA